MIQGFLLAKVILLTLKRLGRGGQFDPTPVVS